MVQQLGTGKNKWAVSVNGDPKELRFSSFQLANAYAFWLAMSELLELWIKDSDELYEKLKLQAEEFHAEWLATDTSKKTPSDMKRLAISILKLKKELDEPLVNAKIELKLHRKVAELDSDLSR